ncbi:hypothetical protein K0U07_04140 [bacterium]|nr:hypothetical protein [bacterium]
MADSSQDLRKELKAFIHATKGLIDSKALEEDTADQALVAFAEKVHTIHHFSEEVLEDKSADEEKRYNARILKDLTESPIYNGPSKNTCSLVSAADKLRHDQEFSGLKSIISGFIKDQISAEVLIDNLSVIYKELAA